MPFVPRSVMGLGNQNDLCPTSGQQTTKDDDPTFRVPGLGMKK